MTHDGFTRLAEREVHAKRVGYVEAGLLLAMIVYLAMAFVLMI